VHVLGDGAGVDAADAFERGAADALRFARPLAAADLEAMLRVNRRVPRAA